MGETSDNMASPPGCVPAREIKEAAAGAGFSLCGIAPYRVLCEQVPRLEGWLARGKHGGLGYMERNTRKRADPRGLFPGTRSVVVCAVNYRNSAWESPLDGRPQIASYAFSKDYHPSIKAMLGQVLRQLSGKYPGLEGRGLTDSAPIFEKAWAVEAGLGWIGKNSLLINRKYGSSLLLGELLLNFGVDVYDRPYQGEGCAGCSGCEKACPAGAILPGRAIDAARCISRLTVETNSPGGDAATGGWVFGCDLCQRHCPHNRRKPYFDNPLFAPVIDPLSMDRDKCGGMTREEFVGLFTGTPLERPGLDVVFGKIKAEVSKE